MKKILFAVFISLLIIPACRKSNMNPGGISGSWKMIEVYDKNTATTSFPPAGSNADVVITFLNGNQFAGHTLRNSLTDGTYTQNGNEITFGSFSITKVGEDEWGGSFLTVLSACYLQSVSPCSPSAIMIQGNLMKITSPMRYNITLEKF
jgi:hypothetical protein